MSVHPSILSAAYWRRPGIAPDAAALQDIYEIEVQAEIAAFPGPAMLFDASGKALAANGDAARLINAMDGGAAHDIRVLLASVAATGRPAAGQIYLPLDPVTGDAQALYYLTALALSPPGPAPDQRRQAAGTVLLLGRDATAEYAMRHALIESRDLYRDLSRCSSDFSWQTDENGAFTFVSAKGALGYSAQALNGRRSQDLFAQSGSGASANPFAARSPVENIEVSLYDAKGGVRHYRISALPVHDKKNHWRGARGVGTDITEAKLHQQALEFMRQREAQVRAIVDATHRTLDSEAAFCEAAAIIAQNTGAIMCAIAAVDNAQKARLLGTSNLDCAGAEIPEIVRARLAHDAIPMLTQLEFNSDGRHHYVVFTSHGGKPNGAIWLQYPADWPPPVENAAGLSGAPSLSLAQTVASQIGIAIAHDNQMRRLAELSRTDELTGLMNRRAFMEDLHHRHGHLYRMSRKGALLYIDLDNFKPVNDRFGHAAGDRVLKQFAKILLGHSRIGDLCARLGGDEFAIWLEETDTAGAEAKARHLIEEARMLPRLAGLSAPDDMPRLGLSIGIAIADSRFAEQLPQLIMRADEVMYQVKRQGKGSLLVADPAAPGENLARVEG